MKKGLCLRMLVHLLISKKLFISLVSFHYSLRFPFYFCLKGDNSHFLKEKDQRSLHKRLLATQDIDAI